MLAHFDEPYAENIYTFHAKGTNYRMYMPHIHNGYEVNLCLTGGVIFQIGEKSYQVETGTVIVMNDNEIHMNTVPPESLYERRVLNFKPAYIAEMTSQYPELLAPYTKRWEGFSHCVKLTAPQLEELTGRMQVLCDLMEAKAGYCLEFKRKHALLAVLLTVAEAFHTFSEGQSAKARPMSRQMLEITAYIKENLYEELSLENICNAFYLSKSNLIRLFKEEICLTPSRYIAVQRIIKAREYLQEGLPVSVVCNRVGYKDQSSFIRIFKQVVGCTPKQYAKQR